MKNIVIIGDSFGVPNWYGPPGPSPEHHVEFLLRDIKHNGSQKYEVTNLSINGSDNTSHIFRLKQFITLHPLTQIDYIVWFQNAFVNLICTPHTVHRVHDLLTESLVESYNDALAVKNQLIAKWVVIGGSTPTPEFFYNYKIHDYIIPDWRSMILKEKLPFAAGAHVGDLVAPRGLPGTQVTGLPGYGEDIPGNPRYGLTNATKSFNHELNTESSDFKKHVTRNLERVQASISSNKELFPDGVHPGLGPHLELSKELDTYFTFGTGPGAVTR